MAHPAPYPPSLASLASEAASCSPTESAGIYVDNLNLLFSGGFRLNPGALRQIIEAQAHVLRAVVYTGFDVQRAAEDPAWAQSFWRYSYAVERQGYELYRKRSKSKTRSGVTFVEADCDAIIASEIACDVHELGLSKVVLASGDGDFCPLVTRLRGYGVFVEVVGLRNVSASLRRIASRFTSGFDIPGFVLATDPPLQSQIADGAPPLSAGDRSPMRIQV